MSIRKINLSEEGVVREKILSGVQKTNDMVSKTLGPHGRSILIERGMGEPLMVDDGRRTAEEIKLDDAVEHLAARILYAVTRKTDEKVGDGTTTSMVLAHAIMEEVAKNYIPVGEFIQTGAGVSHIKSVSEVDSLIQKSKENVFKLLDEMAKPIKSKKELIDVATVSVGDEKLGKIIGEMYHDLGEDGHITLEFNLTSEEIETDVVPGLRFSGGYAANWMVTDNVRKIAEMEDAYLLITKKKDLEKDDIDLLVKEVSSSGKDKMVIIAPKFTQSFLRIVYMTAVKSKFPVLCIRAPGRTEEALQDIAIFSGGKYFNDHEELKQARKKDLGYVDRVEVSDDTTFLIGGRGDKKVIKKRIEEVKAEAKAQKLHQFKQERLERASALAGGVGVIKIGAPTDEERNWVKEKVQDGKWATKQAFKYGVIPGGGQTFKAISEKLPSGDILKNVLMAPYNTLKANAPGMYKIPNYVLDPVSVEKAALANACSAAAKLIRIGGAIAFMPKHEEREYVLDKVAELFDNKVEEDE